MHTHPWRVKMRFNLHIYFLLLCWAPRVKMMFAYLLFVAYLLGHEKLPEKKNMNMQSLSPFEKWRRRCDPSKLRPAVRKPDAQHSFTGYVRVKICQHVWSGRTLYLPCRWVAVHLQAWTDKYFAGRLASAQIPSDHMDACRMSGHLTSHHPCIAS